jgi:hypothetical protein
MKLAAFACFALAFAEQANKPPTCLCVFDVERTLTGKQEELDKCPANYQAKPAVTDTSYTGAAYQSPKGRDLTLSEVGIKIHETFCKDCYVGLVASTHVMEKDVRGKLEDHLNDKQLNLGKTKWLTTTDNCMDFANLVDDTNQNVPDVSNAKMYPAIVGVSDGMKEQCVKVLVDYFRQTGMGHAFNPDLADEEVYFFDDKTENVQPFKNTFYNAHQVSCGDRDEDNSAIGLCGAKTKEIVNTKGVTTCDVTSKAPYMIDGAFR